MEFGARKWASRIFRWSKIDALMLWSEHQHSGVKNIRYCRKIGENCQKHIHENTKKIKSIQFGKWYQKQLFFIWFFISDNQKSLFFLLLFGFRRGQVNYCTPGPRRVWKGSSEPQLHPPFPDESSVREFSRSSFWSTSTPLWVLFPGK